MRATKLLVLLALLAFFAVGPEANADGPLRNLLGKNGSANGWSQSSSASGRASSASRNLNQGRSVLPSGRSYYQGRYYGNFNNRFYGPQYGYF